MFKSDSAVLKELETAQRFFRASIDEALAALDKKRLQQKLDQEVRELKSLRT